MYGTATIQPPENLIAVDAVDNGNSNVIHDLSDSLHYIKGLHDNIQNFRGTAVSNIENKRNGITVQCTETWSSEGDRHYKSTVFY